MGFTFNDDLSFDEKKQALAQLEEESAAPRAQVLNRLFFMAKNGAIDHLLREFEHYFRDKGFAVKATWDEHSRGAAVRLVFLDKKKVEHSRTIYLERSVERAPDDVSPCMYAVKRIDTSEYYRVMPKFAVDIHELMSAEEFQALATRLVNGANYPFTYASHSGC